MELFDNVNIDSLAKSWQIILDKQVELFAPREFVALSDFGFPQRFDTIFDAGCGNGTYCLALKEHAPNSKIVAADCNIKLLDSFKAKLTRFPKNHIDVIKWAIGREESPPNLVKFDAAIVRLTLQHLKKPKKFLEQIRHLLKENGFLFIIEEDDGFFQIDPDLPEFRRVLEIWNEYAKNQRGNRIMGRSTVALAASSGLKVKYARLISSNNFDIGIKPLLDYFKATIEMISLTNPKIVNKTEKQKIFDGLNNFAIKNENRCFLNYPEILTVAKKE